MSKTNMRDELLGHIQQREMKCAWLHDADSNYNEVVKWQAILPVGYTPADLCDFLASINHTYDSGYGGQELYGNIWYTDGTWSSRGEYDGSEWWEHHECPAIPESLMATYESETQCLL